MLRYSFRDIFNIMETSPSFYLWNPNNVSANYDQFSQDLRTLLDSKRVQAAAGGSLRKFAAGNATAPNNQTLYSVVQCTPDLSDRDCSDCLAGAMEEIPNCCDGRQGGRVIRPSCNFRFEVSLFYDATADNASSPSLSPPPPPVPSVSPPAAIGKESNKSQTVIIVVPIISFVVLIIISFCIYLRVRKPREKPQSKSGDEIRSVESLQLGFGTIKVATYDFSDANKLGQGGFGVVYKGKLSNGQVIAVKRLSKNSIQGDLKFKNEVLLVAKLQHRNLVRLLGFCLEGIERLLIYEFVPNGSLDNFIFDPIKCVQLDWARRYKIIGGIAREYAMHGQFSVKFDVFSFGVLVLEIISGRKNNSFRNGENIEGLLSYAWKNWKQGIVSNLVDPTLKASSTTEIMRCIHIGLLCVQENVVDRPTMASVVLMLNSFSITLPIPSKPAFFMNSGTELNICLQGEHDSRVTESNQSKSSSVQASINEVSITELSPR
nr:cysteine-rich receptor-like protein kinase 28 [Quercus suber]